MELSYMRFKVAYLVWLIGVLLMKYMCFPALPNFQRIIWLKQNNIISNVLKDLNNLIPCAATAKTISLITIHNRSWRTYIPWGTHIPWARNPEKYMQTAKENGEDIRCSRICNLHLPYRRLKRYAGRKCFIATYRCRQTWGGCPVIRISSFKLNKLPYWRHIGNRCLIIRKMWSATGSLPFSVKSTLNCLWGRQQKQLVSYGLQMNMELDPTSLLIPSYPVLFLTKAPYHTALVNANPMTPA